MTDTNTITKVEQLLAVARAGSGASAH